MSELEDSIEILIKESLPSYSYKKQHYIFYRNTKLFFDFYIPALKVFIEVQGKQHYDFSSFFHKDIFDFNVAKIRDGLKEEWCELKGYKLIKIPYNDVKKLSAEDLKTLIIESL